ncbi:MAG: discoidin domain-containing protein, partial [Anaerolineae bacterium]
TRDFTPAGRQSLPTTRIKPAPEPPGPETPVLRGTAIAASTFEPGEGEISHAVDGDENTFWHSRWSSDAAQPPHFLTVDYGREIQIAEVIYVARMDMANGHVRDYEIYLSRDGQNWGEPAIKGRIPAEADEERIKLPAPVKARYLKLVVLNAQRNQPYATVAELSVVEAPTGQ